MSKITVTKDKSNPYLLMDKTGLQDETLSRKAKWILAYLLSLPDDWQIYIAELVKHSKDWKDSTSSGIQELMEAGYITRQLIHNDKWQFSHYDYTVLERPWLAETGKPDDGKPDDGESEIGKSATTNKWHKWVKKEKNNKDKAAEIYFENELVNAAFIDFIADRTERRKSPTSRAIKDLIKELNQLSKDSEVQVKIIRKSIKKWRLSFYPLDETNYAKPQGESDPESVEERERKQQAEKQKQAAQQAEEAAKRQAIAERNEKVDSELTQKSPDEIGRYKAEFEATANSVVLQSLAKGYENAFVKPARYNFLATKFNLN